MNPKLVQEARQLLAEASVIPEASAAALAPATSHGKAEDSAPTIGGQSTFDSIAQSLQNAKDDATLERRIREWREHLDGLKARKTTPAERKETTVQRDWRIIRDYEGTRDEIAASTEGVDVKHIRKLREDNQRSPVDGRRRDWIERGGRMKKANPEERAARARDLYDDGRGLSARQIALKFGVSHTQILEDLGRNPRKKAA